MFALSDVTLAESLKQIAVYTRHDILHIKIFT